MRRAANYNCRTILEEAFLHSPHDPAISSAARALAYEYDNHRSDIAGKTARVAGRSEQCHHGRLRRRPPHFQTRRAAHSRSMIAPYDAILTPSAPGAALAGLGSTGEATFNRLWTLLGVAVRQRAGHCRRPRACRLASRSSAAWPRRGRARKPRGLWRVASKE